MENVWKGKNCFAKKKKSFVMRKISILTFLNFEKIIPRWI